MTTMMLASLAMGCKPDCPMCSGEYCERHITEPCDCDVIERHEPAAHNSESAQPNNTNDGPLERKFVCSGCEREHESPGKALECEFRHEHLEALPPFKFEAMTLLAERVVSHGTCSKCHTKTLVERNRAGDYVWSQCSKCLTIFVEDSATAESSP